MDYTVGDDVNDDDHDDDSGIDQDTDDCVNENLTSINRQMLAKNFMWSKYHVWKI